MSIPRAFIPILLLATISLPAEEFKLVPYPKEVQAQKGEFVLTRATRIVLSQPREDRLAAEMLAEEIESGGGHKPRIVSGRAATEINTKLAAKGLASEPTGDGVRIRPSLPLRDAVALSKDLGSEGFKVQVRRGGGASAAATSPAASASADGATLYRVRVGGYPDRAAAQTVVRELREKGYEPFIAKGRE